MPHNERPKVEDHKRTWCQWCCVSFGSHEVRTKLADGRVVHNYCVMEAKRNKPEPPKAA